MTIIPTTLCSLLADIDQLKQDMSDMKDAAVALAAKVLTDETAAALTSAGLQDLVNSTAVALEEINAAFTLAKARLDAIEKELPSPLPGSDEAPSFTLQPVDMASKDGQPVLFLVKAAGFPAPSIKWQASPALPTFSDVVADSVYSGENTDTLTVVASISLNGTKFQAVATNRNGSVTSNPVILTVAS